MKKTTFLIASMEFVSDIKNDFAVVVVVLDAELISKGGGNLWFCL